MLYQNDFLVNLYLLFSSLFMVLTLEHKHWYHFVWKKRERKIAGKRLKKQNGQQNGCGGGGGGQLSNSSFRFQLNFTQKQLLEKRSCWRCGERSDPSTKPRQWSFSSPWWRFRVTASMIYLYVKTEITETTSDNEFFSTQRQQEENVNKHNKNNNSIIKDKLGFAVTMPH